MIFPARYLINYRIYIKIDIKNGDKTRTSKVSTL